MADDFAIPHPGLGIDRLTDGAEQAQTVELVFSWPLFPPLDERADGGWRSIENAYLMPVDDAPEAIRLRAVGRAFIHHCGGAVLQRSVDNVAVARDPSDVGRAPVRVFFLEIEHPFCRDVGADGIATCGVDDAFGFSGRARCVENVERMFGVERFGWTFVRDRSHQFMPPVIAPGLQMDWRTGALVDDNVLYRRAGLQRLFDGGKQFDFGAAAIGTVLCDDGYGLRIVNAVD